LGIDFLKQVGLGKSLLLYLTGKNLKNKKAFYVREFPKYVRRYPKIFWKFMRRILQHVAQKEFVKVMVKFLDIFTKAVVAGNCLSNVLQT